MGLAARSCGYAIQKAAVNSVGRSKMNKRYLCSSKNVASGGASRFSHAIPCLLVTLTSLTTSVVVRGDSLWKERGAPQSLVSDKRAYRVGDILSILVQENSVATKNNNTKTSKATGLDASISSFLYSPAASHLLTKGGTLPAL